ncbi:chaperone protein DnaJ 2-like isoform X2 [Anopheles funestus]|uniref:chaperone protein DnaJ 2-like isoform X2 n=1 Tax=Anopheles funestus TaxID=62324 RepID=UPI0020C693B9|nr:chaperone protein DnaJ 2-like isoform X2 [Anopheles funestus]
MSTQNYYAALGVCADAPMTEVCRAYQYYAPLCHPDSKLYSSIMFPIKDLTQQDYWLLVNEACEVLTNAEWRARYNVGSLKTHPPEYVFSGDCLGIYNKFYIVPFTSAPPPPTEECIDQPAVLQLESLATIPTLVFVVEVDIEDLFAGVTKLITYPRMVMNNGRYTTIMHTLDVPITPYMRHQGSFAMKGFGHEGDQIRSDVVVVLNLNPHPFFTISGDDLICNATIPLSTALLGGKLKVQTIDSKTISTHINPMHLTVYPLVKQFNGEGLKTPEGRGNMIVNITIKMPRVPPYLRKDAERLLREMEKFTDKKERGN